MPSNKEPKSTVISGAGKLPPAVVPASALTFPVGVGSAGAQDPTPPATEIPYGGGPNWADGSTNPASSVEGQLDKIITDLATGFGATRVGAGGTGNFANGSPATGSTIQAVMNDIVAKLAATAGAARVGSASTGNFADGSPATGAALQTLINDIVARLAASAGSARVGSAVVGASFTNAPFTLSAGSILAQLTELLAHTNAWFRIRTATGAITLHNPNRDGTILLNPASSVALNLPNPNTCTGWKTLLINGDGLMSSSFKYTLTRASGEKINNVAADYVLDLPGGRWWLTSDGTDWYVALDLPGKAADGFLVNSPTISGTPVITASSVQATGNARGKLYSDIASTQTSNATPVNAFTWTIPDEAVSSITVEASAIRSDGSVTASYIRRCRIKRDGGTVTVGTVAEVYTDEEGGFSAADVTINNSGSTGRVQVTGIAATTIDWVVVVSRLEHTHA